MFYGLLSTFYFIYYMFLIVDVRVNLYLSQLIFKKFKINNYLNF
jgi:hypothetical protein